MTLPVGSDTDTSVAERIAETLVSAGGVTFRTSPFFRLTSGMDSPVYVDNRQLLGHVDERREIVQAIYDAATSGTPVGAVAATATAGIPWGAWLADRLELPLLYVRSEAKAWGKERAVEGTAPSGTSVLVIEDLAFSAGSLMASAVNLRDAGFEVKRAITILSYDMPKALARLKDLNLEHQSLTTIDDALAASRRQGSLDANEVALVAEWLRSLRSR